MSYIEIIGIDESGGGISSALARNWAAYFCVVQLSNGNCVEVCRLGRDSEIADVMERTAVQELYLNDRLLKRDESVAQIIPRGAVLRSEPRKDGRFCG